MGVGIAAQAEPGLASPYEGIGDQAAAVGPALMIRTGEDLVMLVFSGVDERPPRRAESSTLSRRDCEARVRRCDASSDCRPGVTRGCQRCISR